MRRPTTLPEPRRILTWVYLGRFCVASGIFAAAAVAWRDMPPGATLAASMLLAVSGLFTAVSFWYTHLADRPAHLGVGYGQTLYDVLLVTGVVHLTGGKESDLVSLYVLVIVAAAMLLPRFGSMLLATLASLLYLALVVWSPSELDLTVALQVTLFITVGLVTGLLGDRLRSTGAVLGAVETELRLLRLDTDDVLASIATGILTVDGSGRLAYVNPAARDLLGLSSEDWVGRPILHELDRVAPGLGSVIGRSLASRTPVRRFETKETARGMVLGVSTTLIQRAAPELPSVTAIFQDITERQRIDLLRRRAERLEAVAELSASLAHEIKNPLASIRSATEQLTGDGIDPEDRGVLRGLVVRESDRLSRLLAEFIDFARVKMRSADAVPAVPMVRDAVDLARAHPDASGVEVHVRIGPGADAIAVQGDADLLHRAILNLVLNGAQWSGAGGRVEVEVEVLGTDLVSPALGAMHTVRVRVTDTGPGVAAHDVDKVFDPFFTLRPGGTGLGLALVQRAAEAHGGTVAVDEARGAPWGATFSLYLPAAGAPPTAEPAALTGGGART